MYTSSARIRGHVHNAHTRNIVCGWKDGERFNSIVPVSPLLLRREIERWFNAQQLPPDDGLVDSWEYAEYASAKLIAGQPTAQPDPQLDLLFQ